MYLQLRELQEIECTVHLIGLNDFDIIDTGGFLPKEKDIMNKHIQQQGKIAIKEADLIILLVDGKDEITSSDRILADMVIRSQKSQS